MNRHILLILLIFKAGVCFENYKPNVAIIGGGIGGAASSHFLTELFNNNLNIDLYEAKTIGGRLATVEIDQNEFEAGGSIIHPQNKYMQEFAKLLGLEQRSSSDQRAGIWNGNEIVFEESNWGVVSLAKLLYRYGIQPFSLNRYINAILNDFAKIYDLQDAGKSFENVTSLLAAMNKEFPKLLNISVKDHLLKLGYSEQLLDEIVKAPLVVDYGQDTNIHSFVGSVALAGADFNLWAIKGGNKQVPEHLIYRNKNVNVIPSCVTKIVNMQTKDDKTLYELHYHNKDSTTMMQSRYDIVIIATPLTNDQAFPISFEGFPKTDFHGVGKYHETIATFIKGDLKPHYFGLDEELDAILSCDPNKTIISSVGKVNSVKNTLKHSRVWKIFSNAPLELGIIEEMFSNLDKVKEINWKAYPEYSTNIQEANFRLHTALYHVNAIEWAASAMEMSAISGRNVAILAHADFSRRCNCKIANMYTDVPENTPSNEL
ncbi:prenylcysteine oxidase 1 [Calliopsis andreniformis]|uniref:prenylcysteine oxidase 1 n=1 Tax=Calliopsis andreniformis TaxID=337506 RepID=UPI003FCEB95C